MRTKREPMRLADILSQVAERHGLSVADLTGPSRRRHVAWPRQEAMAEAWARTDMSLAEIGRRLGGRDHGTVMHGIRAHERRQVARRMANGAAAPGSAR